MTPYQIAQAEIGIHETPGPKATARIVEYHSATSLKATSDEVPWCSSFVNWCCKQAGIKGTGSAAAASWLKWGLHTDEKPGAVIVIKHKGADKATGSASGYHVGFFVSRPDENHVRILGGNQHDSVKESDFGLAAYSVVDVRESAELVELPEAA